MPLTVQLTPEISFGSIRLLGLNPLQLTWLLKAVPPTEISPFCLINGLLGHDPIQLTWLLKAVPLTEKIPPFCPPNRLLGLDPLQLTELLRTVPPTEIPPFCLYDLLVSQSVSCLLSYTFQLTEKETSSLSYRKPKARLGNQNTRAPILSRPTEFELLTY